MMSSKHANEIGAGLEPIYKTNESIVLRACNPYLIKYIEHLVSVENQSKMSRLIIINNINHFHICLFCLYYSNEIYIDLYSFNFMEF